MEGTRQSRRVWAVIGITACVVLTSAFAISGAMGQDEEGSTAGDSVGPQYTVVETDGTLLIVTDNGANRLYFYTLEEEASPGDPLHLRGAIDLTQVGTATITPRIVKQKNE